MVADDERFDASKVTQLFQQCLCNDDDISMDEYLTAYEQINKFFSLMGNIFGFVSSDIRSKLDVLYRLRNETNADNSQQHFQTFKTMLKYEIEGNLLKDSKYVSGSRTLLRLHRGLEFLYDFLHRLGELEESQKTHNCCKAAYECTLAKHHPWMVRKGALMAMYALPTKGELLKRVCTNVCQAIDCLPDMLKFTKLVYDRTDALYTLYNLHQLP